MPKYELSTTAEVVDYDSLRSYVGKSDAVSVSRSASPGVFAFDPTDTTSADDGDTVIVSNVGKRWKRVSPPSTFLQSGTGAVARTFPSKLREIISVQDFGATGDGTTDDLPAIQAAIDYAINNGSHRVVFGPGTYIINGTIKAYSPSGFRALELVGANGAFIGVTKLQHHSSQLINPLLAIQAGRSVRIADIAIYGNNVAPTALAQLGDGTYVNSDRADWITAGCQDTRYAPYCGIAIDPLTGSSPGVGVNYTFDSYGRNSSSKVVIERCRMMNFVVGLAVGPRNSDSGTEDMVIRDCTFVENVYSIVTTGSQQRAIITQDCNFGGHWCNFDNATYGLQNGQPITIRGALINKSYRLFQSKSDIGVLNVDSLYCESVASIGIIGTATSGAALPASFKGCNFSIIGLDDDGTVTNKDETLKAAVPLYFTGCSFVSQFQMTMSLQKPAVFDACSFKCENSATDTTPGERENFGVHVPEGQEHRVIMRNCEQRVTSGTAKLLDTEPVVYSLPTRAYIMPHTSRILRAGNKTTYKLSNPAVTRTATLSTISYDSAEQLSFTETTSPAIIMLGDVLDWRVNLPVLPGASAETAIVPALRVTGVSGTTITCKVTGKIDTTYSPSSVPVRVRQFINGTVSTGNTTNASDQVTSVTSIANFQVGDWIYFSDTGVTFPVRITAINSGAGSMTVHRTLNKSTTGVSIYNTLLTAL